MAVIIRGTKNKMANLVAKDISKALLKEVATNGKPAECWSREEQILRLDAMFQKYKIMGGVWNSSAEDVGPVVVCETHGADGF